MVRIRLRLEKLPAACDGGPIFRPRHASVIRFAGLRLCDARVIADGDQTYEVPPLNSVLAGTVDSIRASDMPLDAFEEAWEIGSTLTEFQPLS